MIDTNELRELADSLQYSHACKCGYNGRCHTVNIMEDAADELDRLYEIERRTTPLTREEIEAELVRRGFKLAHNLRGEAIYRKSDFFDSGGEHFDNVLFLSDGAIRCMGESQSFHLRAVTLQLLDAVLEWK